MKTPLFKIAHIASAATPQTDGPQRNSTCQSNPAHQTQNDENDQDDADDTDAAVSEAVTVAAEAATEASEDEE